MDHSRETLLQCLGKLPQPERPVSARLLRSVEMDCFTAEYLLLDLNGYEPVPAIFTRPKCAGPFPVVLYTHSSGYLYELGKTELLSGRLPYTPNRGYAGDLAERGIAALAIDHICFEDRRGITESAVFKKLLWHGRYLWSYMVFDSLRAIDYLCTRPDVNPDRIAAVGMSMGSTMVQWVGALDTRVKVCVDLCGLTNYNALEQSNNYDAQSYYFFVPGFCEKFTCAQLNALIAPRYHFCLAAEYDPHTPIWGLVQDDTELSEIYRRYGATDHWQMKRYPVGHVETEPMRADVLFYLSKHL